MKYFVTIQDIEKGVRGASMVCPVALALRRVHTDVSVGAQNIWLGRTSHLIPEDVNKIIAYYDEQGKMDPFSFELPE